jgi:hypothetical protein
VNRTVTVKMAVYFFCIISGALLCAMELKLQEPHDYCVAKKILLCDEIMEKYAVPQDVISLIKRDSFYSDCLLRMDTIYKKFDPFFNFNAAGYKSMCAANKEVEHSYTHIEKSCRKFWAIKPRTVFFFKNYQDEILSSLISRPGCFIHNAGNFHIELTSQERVRVCLLPDEFQAILHEYSQSYDKL